MIADFGFDAGRFSAALDHQGASASYLLFDCAPPFQRCRNE